MNLYSELVYFFSPKKNEELLRKLLRKNPRWAKGHQLLAEMACDEGVREVSLKAYELLNSRK